jgi:hypothetical protein
MASGSGTITILCSKNVALSGGRADSRENG